MLFRTALILLTASLAVAAPPAPSEAELDSLVDLYVALHKAPEPSFPASCAISASTSPQRSAATALWRSCATA
jgi:hypothetical protein